MKLLKQITLALIFASIFFMLSCEKTENDLNLAPFADSLSREEAITEIESCTNQFSSHTKIIKELKSLKVINELQDLNSPFESEEYESEDDEFNFSNYVGTYTYNFETKKWDKENTPSDKIIFNFPALEHNNTNNSTLTINNIELNKMGEDEDEMPQKIDLELKHENKLIMQVNFVLEMPNESALSIFPKKVELDVVLDDYTANIAYSLSSANSIKFKVNYKDEAILDSHIAITVKENLPLPATLNGYIKLFNLELRPNLKLEELFKSFTEDQEGNNISNMNDKLNEYINLNIGANNNWISKLKIATIENSFKRSPIKGNDNAYDFYFLFKDNSQEKVSKYLEPLKKDLEDLLDFFEDIIF